jgi:hypothetical protein
MNEPKEVQVDSAFNCELTLTEEEDGVIAALDISEATEMLIMFKPASGEELVELTATHITDGGDGQLQATISAALNDTVGTIQVQAKVTIDGQPYYSKSGSIEVLDNLS